MPLRRAALAVIPLAVLCSTVVALTSRLGLDYFMDAGRGIKALSAGDITGWAAVQPQMGQLTIVLRAPADMLGLGDLWAYRLGCLVLLMGPVVLLTYLRATTPMTRSGALALIVLLCLNPVTLRALKVGHPEEILGGSLCALAMLCALDRRAGWAGLALGLAVATKQWALFAVLPVAFACATRAQRRRMALVAVPIAALFTLPPILLDPHAFLASMSRPLSGLAIMRPGNLWSLIVPQPHFIDAGGSVVELMVVPGWLRSLAHPLVVGIALLLAMGWRHRTSVRPETALALLALVFLTRCVLDPWNHGYYHWPFLAALACWELRGHRRVPVVTALSSAWLWLVFVVLRGSELADPVYMVVAVFLMVRLVGETFEPAPLRRLERSPVVQQA